VETYETDDCARETRLFHSDSLDKALTIIDQFGAEIHIL
jgi:hypothetical protein